jgi:UDP-N-acetylglucosamine--N-acetylmuramyl-(pentapeptide) pyrophosphoryl-undecaprenol N-acetylglucosamine transferase
MSRRPYAVIAGGGTAGHVFVSSALAGALADRGVPAGDIELFASGWGPDSALLAGSPFPVTLLPGRGIRRRVSPEALAANAGALAGLGAAGLRSLSLLVRRRPRVVVSVGGYASVPPGLAAAALRIPLVVVNVDRLAGAAQRLLGRFAAASAVAFAGTALPRAVVTGAPVRAGLAGVERTPASTQAARQRLGLPTDRATVAVFGGSLGARRLNEAALALAMRWRDRPEHTLFHVSGPRNHDEVQRVAADAGLRADGPGLHYRLVAFQDDMASLYQAADLAICRAGALSVAELTTAGLPAVLVPLPGAPGDHQSANAAVLVEAGAARLVRDDACDVARLDPLVDELLADRDRLSAMAAAARGLGHPGATEAVADLVQGHAG